MAKLFAAQRNKLPSSDFALPSQRAFPIENKSHAIQALRMKGHASPPEQSEIESKVATKFPGVGGGLLKKKSAEPKPMPSLMKRLTGK